jgi:uncharacterized protein (DUF983 family)
MAVHKCPQCGDDLGFDSFLFYCRKCNQWYTRDQIRDKDPGVVKGGDPVKESFHE